MNKDFTIQNDHYYNIWLSNVYIDPEYKSKKIVCNVCLEDFYFINSKDELLKLIQETLIDNDNFPLEMIKLMRRFYYPGADYICFNEKKGLCSYCCLNKPKFSFRKTFNKFFKR